MKHPFCSRLRKFAVVAASLALVSPLLAEDSAASAAALGDRTPAPDQALTEKGADRARALALYYKGNELTAEGKIDEAVDVFRDVIAIDSTNIELAARTAAMLAQLGKHDEARKVVEEAKTANPDDVAGAVALVEFLRSFMREDEDAQTRMMEVASEAMAQFPKEPRAYKLLVRAHVEKDDWEAASAALETALSQEDVDPEFWVLIGRLGQEIWPYRGDRAAEENLERLMGIYYRALEMGADTPRDVQHSVARFFRSTGQLDDARGLYQGMAEALPEDLGTRALYARTLLAMGRGEEGIAELEKLAEIDPNDLETHEILAEAYTNLEDFEQAARHTTAAIRLGANSLATYLTGINLYINARDDEGLIAHLRRAKITFPEEPYFPRVLGSIYSNRSDWENAIAEFEEAERIALDHPEPEIISRFNAGAYKNLEFLHYGFYFDFGAAAERLGQFERAAELFQKSIDLVPEEDPVAAARAYNYLGYMWLEQETNIEEAGNLIRLAVDLSPESGAFADSLGWYYFLTGDYTNALTELLRADSLMRADYTEQFENLVDEGVIQESDRSDSGGADPTVLEHIARTHAKLGDLDKALKVMEEAASLEGATDEMKDRLERYKNDEFE